MRGECLYGVAIFCEWKNLRLLMDEDFRIEENVNSKMIFKLRSLYEFRKYIAVDVKKQFQKESHFSFSIHVFMNLE